MKFTREMFVCICPRRRDGEHWDFCEAQENADCAQAAFDKWLNEQPVVYWTRTKHTEFLYLSTLRLVADTHVGRLVLIEEIGK